MSIKVFQTNANGKIELTRCELEKLLNEIYNEGYCAGENKAKGQYWAWTPNWGTLTGDSANNKIITTNTTNAINDLKCATENLDNICAKAVVETKATPTNCNGAKATITTRRNNEAPNTYTVDLGKNFNLNSMTKALEEILNGYPRQSALEGKTDPFTSLAKELSGV